MQIMISKRVFQLCILLCELIVTSIGSHAAERLKLAATTSTVDTGLLDSLLPPFEKKFTVKVDVISAGTGKAIRLAENGDVDCILVHAREQEEKFVNEGHGVNRRAVMYNDFVIVGPENDPAHVAGKRDAVSALTAIAGAQAPFVSRGDDSGTHQKEKELWKEAGLAPGGAVPSPPKGAWYMETGQGMGATLTIADEKKAYCLADRATYTAFSDKVGLRILCEGDRRLLNQYAIVAVSPARHPHVNYIHAICLIGWLTSPEGQKMIGDFKKKGFVLFRPNAYQEGRGIELPH
jgi:tungstate transport system substrate-binding protein